MKTLVRLYCLTALALLAVGFHPGCLTGLGVQQQPALHAGQVVTQTASALAAPCIATRLAGNTPVVPISGVCLGNPPPEAASSLAATARPRAPPTHA